MKNQEKHIFLMTYEMYHLQSGKTTSNSRGVINRREGEKLLEKWNNPCQKGTGAKLYAYSFISVERII